ncbi:hypothetical protein COL940_001592 [Colletotrichum noveboracense]|nr:hypothetical protein COL940_001592 [Colletotrichum noveboracense]
MARGANNVKIAANMRNTFPSPYLLEHAEGWLAMCAKDPGNSFAICRVDDGAYVGNIGVIRGNDVQYRTWDVGYWVAEDYWGNGLEASAYSSNVASRRVLEKSGWTYEGAKRQAVEKHGQVLDLVLFSILRHEAVR